MRLTIDIEEGSAVRDPSRVHEVGRVVAVIDNTLGGLERRSLVVELDDKKLATHLADIQKQRAF